MRRVVITLCALFAVAACNQPARHPPRPPRPAAKLGIRPAGDTEIQPDMSQVPPDLQKVYAHIDENIDAHVENLQKWIRQPSISNSGEGIPESAEMVKGFFDELGCQQTQVFDVGVTEYGSPGNPVVYAKCDEGAEKTLLIYWMYDTMPVTQPDAWTSPPFEARLVEQAPYKKVLIGRGATNSKGPQMSQLNAFRAIKAVHGKLPVNLIFVAEGDEERMDIGLRKFVKDHPELLAGADAMLLFGGQSNSGSGSYGAGSEGCVYVELTTSGKSWGRGPIGVGHSRLQQAQRRQPGVAPHQDARVAGLGRRQHAADRRVLRGHAADRGIPGSGAEDRGGAHRSEDRRRERRRRRGSSRKIRSRCSRCSATARRSISTASGAATCMRAAPARSCRTRSPRSTTSATCRT